MILQNILYVICILGKNLQLHLWYKKNLQVHQKIIHSGRVQAKTVLTRLTYREFISFMCCIIIVVVVIILYSHDISPSRFSRSSIIIIIILRKPFPLEELCWIMPCCVVRFFSRRIFSGSFVSASSRSLGRVAHYYDSSPCIIEQYSRSEWSRTKTCVRNSFGAGED